MAHKGDAPEMCILDVDCPLNKCPVCQEVGFKKGEKVVDYLYDVWCNTRVKRRLAHADCVLMQWKVFPSTHEIKNAKYKAFLEAI